MSTKGCLPLLEDSLTIIPVKSSICYYLNTNLWNYTSLKYKNNCTGTHIQNGPWPLSASQDLVDHRVWALHDYTCLYEGVQLWLSSHLCKQAKIYFLSNCTIIFTNKYREKTKQSGMCVCENHTLDKVIQCHRVKVMAIRW